MKTSAAQAAGVLIRPEEWLLRCVEPRSDRGELLTCDGVSELVRGLPVGLEEQVGILDDAQTHLVLDRSSHINDSMLDIESILRRYMPNDDRIGPNQDKRERRKAQTPEVDEYEAWVDDPDRTAFSPARVGGCMQLIAV